MPKAEDIFVAILSNPKFIKYKCSIKVLFYGALFLIVIKGDRDDLKNQESDTIQIVLNSIIIVSAIIFPNKIKSFDV